MRISLLTLAMLVAMNSDLQVLLCALALLPAAGALMFVGFLLKPAAKRRRVQGDNARWRGVHRTRQAPGRHSPARGKRLQGLSRQAQLEERTVSVDAAALGLDREALRGDVERTLGPAYLLKETTEAWQAPEPHVHEPYRDGVRLRCRTCRLDLDQPEGMPEIGPHGFSSWT